jgi:spore photoproduct lyase
MPIRHFFVDRAVGDHPTVKHFETKLAIQPTFLDDPEYIFRLIKQSQDPWKKGKEVLWLTRNKGAFIKDCPGTRDYLCCGYRILHIGTYCTMDCSYCILQGYYHPPMLQYFVNHDDLTTELNEVFSKKEVFRIGTGEFTDSLIWESWSDLTPKLIQQFANQYTSVLEIKTKTTAINNLADLNHNRKTIVSWSLNTPRIIKTQERGTARLDARLKAAKQCSSQWGYPIAFHFDPMVIYPGCEAEYLNVLECIFENVQANDIVWISMGTFRCMPGLHPIIKQRFPESDIIYGEFIPGLDGKLRYFKRLRLNLYKQMVDWLNENVPDVLAYFCMESDQVWERSFGFSPKSKGGLANMLDVSAIQHCGLSRE